MIRNDGTGQKMVMPDFIINKDTGHVLRKVEAGENEKPPKTKSPFDERACKHYIFGVHSTKAAKAAAVLGIITLVFILIVVNCHLLIEGAPDSPYSGDHNKTWLGISMYVCLIFLIGALFAHYFVFIGIRKIKSCFLLPFIIIYLLLIIGEALALPRLVANHIKMTVYEPVNKRYKHPYTIVFPVAFIYIIIMIIQSLMLIAVYRCSRYLCEKQHDIEQRGHNGLEQQIPLVDSDVKA